MVEPRRVGVYLGAGGRLQDPIARLVRLAHRHWSRTWFSGPPLSPPHAKIIESDRAAMFGVAQHFSAVLLPTLRPDPVGNIFTDMAADA
jgi:hypothetical protein